MDEFENLKKNNDKSSSEPPDYSTFALFIYYLCILLSFLGTG